MPWHVIFDEDFDALFSTWTTDVQDAILKGLLVLADRGPMLGRPLVDTLNCRSMSNLKELRVLHNGRHWRVLFGFNQNRVAVVLTGGDKTGEAQDRWYDTQIAIAVERAAKHNF